jgi:thioredoxin reductase
MQTTGMQTTGMQTTDELPVVVVGAGPVGLAAAANLRAYDLPVLVLEAGEQVGAAIRAWGHVRTFTPWRYLVDPAAEKLLAPTGWTRPDDDFAPTGAEIVRDYLEPLAAVLGPYVATGARVEAVTRRGLDKSRTLDRERQPFLVRVRDTATGDVTDLTARAVIDASGTWAGRNPLGAAGLPAVGEAEAVAAGLVSHALPDVLGRDRDRFAGRRTLVFGMGHSAANTLLDLARLARDEPGTEVVWAIRRPVVQRVYGGGQADQLPARGRLGSDLRALVDAGAVEQVTGFAVTRLEVAADGTTVTAVGATSTGEQRIAGVHQVVAATGFRPDLAMLGELRLDLDPGLESPRDLAPLIDPAFHSCGTVPPHGHRELGHPQEPGFWTVGMKSYGRAPTFLGTTGNEQVRSIAAHLAGDSAAADEVRLVLPETGVCSATPPPGEDALERVAELGWPGALSPDGRSVLSLTGVAAGEGAGCCG